MSDCKDKTVLIRDYGKFGPMVAERLAREFGRTLLFIQWEREFPMPLDFHVGEGIPGVEKVDDFWAVLDEVDVFVFTDLYEPGLQQHLRNLGKAVWGNGYAERIETDRWAFRQWLKDKKMPRWNTKKVIGMDQLREALKIEDDVYVKISKFRGAKETFGSPNYHLVEQDLNELEHNLGIFAKTQEFIIDSKIEGQECGVDIFTVDGKYPSIAEWGFEVKDEAYLATVVPYEKMPKELRYVNDMLSPEFQKYGARGFFGTEVRIAKDGRPYFIDPAIRSCFPPLESLLESFSNWGDIILHGASGEMITPKPVAKYFALARMHSESSTDTSYPIDIEEKDRQWVKMPDFTIIGKDIYVLPRRKDWDVVGTVVGRGETPQAAIDDCTKRADRISGVKLKVSTKELSYGMECIAEAKKNGVNF